VLRSLNARRMAAVGPWMCAVPSRWLVAALTGGRFGFFRADLSFNAMTDIFGVMLALLIGWLLAFKFPTGATRELGVYLALLGAATVATGAGDFRVTSLFPALPSAKRGNET